MQMIIAIIPWNTNSYGNDDEDKYLLYEIINNKI